MHQKLFILIPFKKNVLYSLLHLYSSLKVGDGARGVVITDDDLGF